MLNNMDPNERPIDGQAAPSRSSKSTEMPISIPMLSDREVPLGKSRTTEAVHAWLDGELPESAVLKGNMVREVEFWRRIDREADTIRQMRAPLYVQEQIMAALPDTAPQLVAPWWRKPFEVSPMTAMLAGAGLVALGLMLGAMRSR